MKVLFLGGVFDDSHTEEIQNKTRTYIEYAANNFQKRLIRGLQSLHIPLEVVSIPFLGAFPTAYSDVIFRRFSNMENDYSGYEYYEFNNIFGYRNISRCRAAKHGLDNFVNSNDDQKLIIVYSPHTPFVRAATWAKHKDPRIKICLVVPDLPQYMNLSEHQSVVYKILKFIDLKVFTYENKNIDSYVVLTRQMVDALNVGSRPFRVIEGICETTKSAIKPTSRRKVIAYTGKLNYAFGVLSLVKAFHQIENSDLRLVICGSGEATGDIQRIVDIDNRIDFKGQVSSEVAIDCIFNSDILVNPRPNDSEYTKYSFPSKIIDYLSTGNPVVAFRLDGMPDVYSDFIFYIPENNVDSIRDTILKVIQASDVEIESRKAAALEYINNTLSRETVARSIMDLNFAQWCD